MKEFLGHEGDTPRKLSEDFAELLRESAGRAVTLGELERRLRGRGFALFILIMSLPFCFPVAIPGLSIPFGIVILLLGLRIAMGHKPDLPSFILRKEISHGALERIVRFGLRITRAIERVARPRMALLRGSRAAICCIGLGLASGGLQLLLPLPPLVPLSNTIPAISVVLLTAGLVERDGIFVLAGYLVNLAAWLYFAAMGAALREAFRMLLRWVGM